MKIVHISIYPPKNEKHSFIGGVASYTKNLVTNMPHESDDEVFVLCNKLNGLRESYREDNINVIRCFDRGLKSIFQIYREVNEIEPDVVHVQQELSLFGNIVTAYLLQWLLLVLKKYKIIITLHGVVSLKGVTKKFIHENNSNLPIWLTRLGFWIIFKPLCTWSDRIIVHENLFKDILVREYGVNPKKIEVIFHGVEALETMNTENACKALDLDSKKDIVLFMGYLTGYKGLDLLIEGFSEYAKENPNAYLIIGSGKHPKLSEDKAYLEEYKRIQDKAKNLIPEKQYRWIGFIDESEIVRYYSASDVSVYPYTVSMSSSGPMALAIGYGKPFLASDVFKGVVSDNLLFSRDGISMANKLREFFENKMIFLDNAGGMKSVRVWSIVSAKTKDVYKRIK